MQVIYYLSPAGKNPVKEFILSLQVREQAKVRRVFSLAEQYGLEWIYPYVKKLTGTPLWEVRIVGNRQIRVLFMAAGAQQVIVLHGFVKKTQKTPPREIAVALQRLKDWRSSYRA